MDDDLNAKIAQRLFGWEWRTKRGWHNGQGQWCRAIPAYTADPAATAEVWRWLEERDGPLHQIRFLYGDNLEIDCVLYHGVSEVVGWGLTWQEALCGAALALAAVAPPEAEEGEA